MHRLTVKYHIGHWLARIAACEAYWCCMEGPLVLHGRPLGAYWCCLEGPLVLHWRPIGAAWKVPRVLHGRPLGAALGAYWCCMEGPLVLHGRPLGANDPSIFLPTLPLSAYPSYPHLTACPSSFSYPSSPAYPSSSCLPFLFLPTLHLPAYPSSSCPPFQLTHLAAYSSSSTLAPT